MTDLTPLLTDIAWPITILIAWLAGEYAHQYMKLPRISAYAVVGFILAPTHTGLLPQTHPATLLLANIAFGLLLFECGYRINLRWLRVNPWIAATSLTETALTFASVYFLARWFGQPLSIALLLAALSMATSPATIMCVINDQRSSGQVTERILHLSALSSVLAVFVFKVIVGLSVFHTSGNLWHATYSSLVVLLSSILLGAISGVLISALLSSTRHAGNDSMLAFTIAVICLVVLAHSLKLSPTLATLVFGLSARHSRIILKSSKRSSGALGELLSVFLFVFIAASLEWPHVIAGISLGCALIAVRLLAKVVGITLFAHISGISWRKGLFVGIATTPISAFVILVLEQTRHLGINFVDQLAPLATAALTTEIFGPIFVQRALIWAHEVPESKKT